MWRPRPKFKVSFYLYFCCFWINVTQINFENIKKIQRIIFDSCFQLKSWFNFDARAPSIPLLNFPFKRITRNISTVSRCWHNSWCLFVCWFLSERIYMPPVSIDMYKNGLFPKEFQCGFHVFPQTFTSLCNELLKITHCSISCCSNFVYILLTLGGKILRHWIFLPKNWFSYFILHVCLCVFHIMQIVNNKCAFFS